MKHPLPSRKFFATILMGLSIGLCAGQARALTVYTAGPGGLIKKLAAGFEAKTGIKVDVFQATTGKVMARLEAEAANPRADILISASWDSAQELDRRGMLLAYQSPNAATVPDAFKSGTYVAQGISALGIVWNTASGTGEPADWSDLTASRYKDKVTMPDPALSGASLDLLLGLQAAQGEGAWKLLQALKDNGLVVSGPNAQALTPVLQGAKAAVFGAVDYVSYASVQKGESIKVIFPSSGTVIAPRPMMIMKAARAPEEARRFVDYVLSEEGQRAVADAWLMPARQDVAALRPLFKDLKLLPQAATQPGAREAALKRFSALFGTH